MGAKSLVLDGTEIVNQQTLYPAKNSKKYKKNCKI
jgi:hypothetical protein